MDSVGEMGAGFATSGVPPQGDPFVDIIVRVLVADGLTATRTAPDRLEVSGRSGAAMEWCFIAGVAFGRSTADLGEASWIHRVPTAGTGAPAEIGGSIGRIVRALA